MVGEINNYIAVPVFTEKNILGYVPCSMQIGGFAKYSLKHSVSFISFDCRRYRNSSQPFCENLRMKQDDVVGV